LYVFFLEHNILYVFFLDAQLCHLLFSSRLKARSYLRLLIPLIMMTNAVAALVIIPAFLNVLAVRKGKARKPCGTQGCA